MTRGKRWVGGGDEEEGEEVAVIHDEEVPLISGVWDSMLFCFVLLYPMPFHSDSILSARRPL